MQEVKFKMVCGIQYENKKHSLGAAAVEFLVVFIMLFEVNQLMLNFFKKIKIWSFE